MMKVARFFLYICIVCFSSCPSKACRENYSYDLHVPVTLSPAKTDYQVGDTLFFEAIMPKSILNGFTNRFETILDQDVTHRSWVTRVDGPEGGSTLDAFMYIRVLTEGSIGDLSIEGFVDNNNVIGQYQQVGDNEFKIAYRFVLLQPGVFWFRIGPFYEDEGQRAEDPIVLAEECRRGSITIYHQMNGGADNNFSLICESGLYCTTLTETNRQFSFDRDGGYVFRVTE
ncbi:MAG: hypothetical protein WBA17_14805 [Saprospiraceae bacterium]